MTCVHDVFKWRVSLTCINDVCLWRVSLTSFHDVYQWRVSMTCVHDVCLWRISMTCSHDVLSGLTRLLHTDKTSNSLLLSSTRNSRFLLLCDPITQEAFYLISSIPPIQPHQPARFFRECSYIYKWCQYIPQCALLSNMLSWVLTLF